MNNLFSDYLKYRTHIDEYKEWQQNTKNHKGFDMRMHGGFEQETLDADSLKKKAKILTEPILLFDYYEHEKTEDSETFFQTYNIELMSVTTLLCSLPIAITKAIPFLNRHADKNKILAKSSLALNNYKNKSFNLAGKNMPLSKLMTAVFAIGSGIFYIKGMKDSMHSQLGLIRKASFDSSQHIIDNPKLFADLTQEQEKQVQDIVSAEKKTDSALINKLKDKVDIKSSFKSVKEYNYNKKKYEKEKSVYFEKLNSKKNIRLNASEEKQAKENQILFENLIKNVEHDVLVPLQRVETVSNIAYSAIFTGGFLEYLISDKLVEVMHVKNKPLQLAMKIGVPLLTYLLLNKNISDIENKAILATKYKHLKKFSENPLEYTSTEEQKKEPLFKFLKNVYHDMKEYDKFEQNELPEIKQRMQAKKQINITKEQEREAKLLQKNTSMVLNNQRERLYEQTVGIESLSETILGPIDILSTALGVKIGSLMTKKLTNHKLSGMFKGIGAVIAFIPAAIAEAKLTKQQKTAEKIASMLSIKDMEDYRKFAPEEQNCTSSFSSNIFNDFIR